MVRDFSQQRAVCNNTQIPSILLTASLGEVKGFGGSRAPKARAESRRRRCQGVWGVGRGVFLPIGGWRGALPLPRKNSICGLQIATLVHCRSIIDSVDCFGHRQPLHDSIMSLTNVIAGSCTEHALADNENTV